MLDYFWKSQKLIYTFYYIDYESKNKFLKSSIGLKILEKLIKLTKIIITKTININTQFTSY